MPAFKSSVQVGGRCAVDSRCPRRWACSAPEGGIRHVHLTHLLPGDLLRAAGGPTGPALPLRLAGRRPRLRARHGASPREPGGFRSGPRGNLAGSSKQFTRYSTVVLIDVPVFPKPRPSAPLRPEIHLIQGHVAPHGRGDSNPLSGTLKTPPKPHLNHPSAALRRGFSILVQTIFTVQRGTVFPAHSRSFLYRPETSLTGFSGHGEHISLAR